MNLGIGVGMANNIFQDSVKKNKLIEGKSAATKALQSGIGNKRNIEPKFKYNAADNEFVLGGNDNNCYIVLGKDKPASNLSGYGGEGGSQCSTIDLVAGRLSSIVNTNNDSLNVDNNFILDAARIYISQRTDVDANFGLADGKVGNAKAKSAIALKADGLRFIAREGIKLVTKTDANNSAGVEILQASGIDLIANNDDANLQPMLLGNNSLKCLQELIEEVDKLSNRIQYFMDEQQKINNAVAQHTHFSPFFGQPTTISPDLAIKNGSLVVNKLLNVDAGHYFQKVNFVGLINKYLYPNGPSYIASKYNRVN
jgi:hypothetical protein